MPAAERTRIDRWLWAARFFKTRGAATDAVLAGRVQVNGARVKPSKEIAISDTVAVRVAEIQWTVIVRDVAAKRGSASIAATLYEETPESIALRAQRAEARRLAGPLGSDLGARPTKRDRRRLDELRGRDGRAGRDGD